MKMKKCCQTILYTIYIHIYIYIYIHSPRAKKHQCKAKSVGEHARRESHGTVEGRGTQVEPVVALPIGLIVVPFWGSYVESYKVIPKRNYYGAYG